MMRRSVQTVVGICVALSLWAALFHGKEDAKNLHYLAWKYHLLPMEPMRALDTMHQDNAFALVLGKSQSDLQHRFGFLRSKQQVRPYLLEYCAASRPGKDVLFLNNSDWMVVMEGDKATDLVYCKG